MRLAVEGGVFLIVEEDTGELRPLVTDLEAREALVRIYGEARWVGWRDTGLPGPALPRKPLTDGEMADRVRRMRM